MPPVVEVMRARALPAAAAFWRWWIGELGALVPTLPAFLTLGASRVDIRPRRDLVELVRTSRSLGERFVESTPIASFEPAHWAEISELIAGHRPRIVLSFPQVYWLNLSLPTAARSRLRSAVALQLREHAPLEPRLLEWRIGKVRAVRGGLRVEVVLVRLDLLASLADDFARNALPLPPIVAERADDTVLQLRPGTAASGFADADRKTFVVACLILLSTPLWALMVDTVVVHAIADNVFTAEQDARPRLAEERRMRAKADVGLALNDVLAAPSVTEVVENLARAMPSTVHATELAGHDDGLLSLSFEALDPEIVSRALVRDSFFLRDVREVGRTKGNDGGFRIKYEARVR